MTRNLKGLGLALVAAFALSAMAASSASATDVFTSNVGSTAITSEPDTPHVFEITGAEVAVECANANFDGTIENGATKATVTPTYSGTPEEPASAHCKSSIGAATVDMNGCAYILTGETTGKDVGETDATVWIECPAEKEIAVTTELVTLHIHEQTPTEGGVTYTNLPNEKVTVKATATGITYSCTPHFFCTLGTIPTEANDAIYTGSTIVKSSSGASITYSEE